MSCSRPPPGAASAASIGLASGSIPQSLPWLAPPLTPKLPAALEPPMKVLFCHPSGLMYTEVFLRLEPLGLELAAAAARGSGHDVRVLDLQVSTARDFHRVLASWRPDAIGFGANYLANLPEVIDLAKEARRLLPGAFVFAGGHSASFTAAELLAHGQGAIDAVVRGEAEAAVGALLAAAPDRAALLRVPGVVMSDGAGPPPELVPDLDALVPA